LLGLFDGGATPGVSLVLGEGAMFDGVWGPNTCGPATIGGSGNFGNACGLFGGVTCMGSVGSELRGCSGFIWS